MHTIGIITGSGPEAGMDLWQKLLQARRAYLGRSFQGDIDAPRVIIISEPRLGLSMDLERNRAEVWNSLSRSCEQIAPQVDHFAIACNTLHAFVPDIERLGLGAHLVSIVSTACAFVRTLPSHSVALLGADPVLRLEASSPYRELTRWAQVEVPRAGVLHELILAIKREGPTPQLEEAFASIVAELKSDTVLLACTELPLVSSQIRNKRVVDVTALLAQRLAQLAPRGCPR